MFAFKGCAVALVTPMNNDGSIDYKSIDKLIEWHIQQGTHAIVAVGTTGESATLSFMEHRQVLEHVVHTVNKRIAVIAGTGANATREAIELTKSAAQCGADACLSVTPYYNKPTQTGLYYHYRAIAEAVAIPQILYNVPARTACDMQASTVARLAKINNIIGIKEATGDVSRAVEIRKLCGSDFLIYSGDDSTAMELMIKTGDGVISVTANVVPRAMVQMSMAALATDTDKANAINNALADLHDELFLEPSPIPVKWAVKQMGLINDGIRLPLTPFDKNLQARLSATLKKTLKYEQAQCPPTKTVPSHA